MTTIDIKDISGQVRFSVPIKENSVFVEELMKSDYIQLSWNSDTGETIPAGSYIEYNGEIYRLLEPYSPSMENEAKYIYSPKFQSRIMAWDKQITPVYTYEQDGTTVKSREMDWTFTGSPADAMYIIKQAIKNETGEIWNIELSSELPATISIQSQSSSIFSVLNTIATECNTEWWADKKTNTLYLSKCIYGDPITLEVGKNIQVPTVTNSGEGYFTRFYAFGSTRNIVQDGTEGNASVNKRLTLDTTKYPNGYKDIRENLKPNEIFVKVLYFDDIYPSSKLAISDVRARLRYRLDNSGNKIKIGGTDEEPVYEQYAIWYFQIAGFEFNPDTIIEGPNLSASFESGQLAGRDFELTYHQENKRVSDSNDVTPFDINAGDYEIIIDETSGQIIPGVAYIIPQDGDSIVLYNIEMPSEYTSSAQTELEAALDKEMSSYEEDNNTYQMSSDPTRFYSEETDVNMGQAITFVNGSQTLSTRAMMVEKRLDLPCYQTIKIGNKIIKGNTQSLKDEVANANQSIDVINAFNELSKSLSQAYANAQREMVEGFARIGNMWKFDAENENTIYTEFNAYSKGELAAGGFSTKGGGGETGGGGGIDENKLWEILAKEGTQQIDKSHITTALSGYATEQWVLDKKYLTEATLTEQLSKYVTLTALSEQLSKYVTLEVFNPFKKTVDAHISNNNIHLTAEEKEKLSWFAKDKDGNIYVTNGLNFYTEGELSAGGFSDEGGSGTGGLFGIIVNGKTYTPEDGYITLPDYSTGSSILGITVNGATYSPVDGYITIPDYPTELAWAKITGKPTTLAGYGITDAYTKTESDERYVTLSTGQTITGAKTFTESISLNQKSIHITNASTYAATGFYWHKRSDGSTISAIGSKTTDGNTLDYLFLGWGTAPYDTETSLSVSSSFLKYKNYDILHTGNYTSTLDARYVKKRGDTMTGMLSIVGPLAGLTIDSINDADPYTYISIRHNGVQGGAYSAYNYIPYFYQDGWRKMWHEGNDGSGSGLDADLLDGIHYQNILERDSSKWLSIGSAGWYRIAKTKVANNYGIAFKLFLTRVYSYANNESYCFDIVINYGANSASITQTSGHSNTRIINKIRVTGNNGDIFYVDIYYSTSSRNNVKWTTLGCAESIDAESNAEALAYTTEFETTNGCKSSLGFVGALTGNAASATKLQTPRTIWGQSFDGTANVSGNMYNVGSINASGAATLGSTLAVTGRLSANGGIYTTDISGNGQALYLGNSNNSSYVYLREDMRSNTDTWTISKAGAATFITLSVSSTSTLTGSVTMGSILSVRGNITCSSNISATGEIAAGSSSDRRLKTILDKQDYIKRLMDIGMVVDYEYNDLAFSRDVRSIERRAYTGLIYQNVKNVLPQMAGEDSDGYGYLNYIHTDYINLIAGALQQTILKQETIEQRVERLERENEDLKEQLNSLRL